jgi:hypothetical protein
MDDTHCAGNRPFFFVAFFHPLACFLWSTVLRLWDTATLRACWPILHGHDFPIWAFCPATYPVMPVRFAEETQQPQVPRDPRKADAQREGGSRDMHCIGEVRKVRRCGCLKFWPEPIGVRKVRYSYGTRPVLVRYWINLQ